MPLISVILPVYNCARYLDESIGSILAQSISDFELICIDDGSSDDSLAKLRKWSVHDPRVKIISRANTGIVGALNDGLCAAQGEYIARMDGDDISQPLRFEHQLRFLQANTDCVALGSRIELIDPEGVRLGVKSIPLTHEAIMTDLVKGQGATLPHPTLFCRANDLREAGGYRRKAEWAEDLDLYLQLSLRGKLANHPDALLLYRRHKGTVKASRHEEQQRVIKNVLDHARSDPRFSSMPIPEYIIHPPLDSRHIRIDFSRLALEEGRYWTARFLALKALRASPLHPKSWFNLAICLLGPLGAGFLRLRHTS